MPLKKKVTCLEGQTQLSFACQHQEQKGQEWPANATEKDDATNATTAQA